MNDEQKREFPEEAVCEDFCIRNRDRILADAKSGNITAKNLVSVHQMLVAFADGPTWGMFMGAVGCYQKETGLPYRDITEIVGKGGAK